MSVELELESGLDKNASLGAAVNDYSVRVKNVEEKMNQEELNRIELLRELDRRRQDLEKIVCENELL